jgi:hypothetical protein
VVRDYDKIGPEIDSLIVAWGKGDAEALATIMNADMDDPRLTETLLVGRNRHWAQWIKARLDKPGTVFVAVGAGISPARAACRNNSPRSASPRSGCNEPDEDRDLEEGLRGHRAGGGSAAGRVPGEPRPAARRRNRAWRCGK